MRLVIGAKPQEPQPGASLMAADLCRVPRQKQARRNIRAKRHVGADVSRKTTSTRSTGANLRRNKSHERRRDRKTPPRLRVKRPIRIRNVTAKNPVMNDPPDNVLNDNCRITGRTGQKTAGANGLRRGCHEPINAAAGS
jgi:hypothetical protein